MNLTSMHKTNKLQIWNFAHQNTSITKSSRSSRYHIFHIIYYFPVHEAALRIDAHPMREREWGDVMGSMEGCRKVAAGTRSQTSPTPSVPHPSTLSTAAGCHPFRRLRDNYYNHLQRHVG